MQQDVVTLALGLQTYFDFFYLTVAFSETIEKCTIKNIIKKPDIFNSI